MKSKPSALTAAILGILLLSVLTMCTNPIMAKHKPDKKGNSPQDEPEISPVTGVSLNPSMLTIFISETETLTATVQPANAANKAVTWTSSDDLVATVSGGGLVTALAAGTVTITASADDKNASCTVTVRESTGGADAPFLINNELELRQVGIAEGWNLSAHYKLMADIAVNGEWTPIGDGNTGFIGSFDGNNKTITGVSIHNSAENYQGMFALIGAGGEVKNLTLDDCYVHGTNNVGGLAGQNRGTVQNCYVSGVVKGENVQIGGVAGANYDTVENCYFTGTVSGTVSQIGGVAGRNEKGTISNCNAEGDVSGTNNTGGVAGYNNAGTIENCYFTGMASGTGNTVGGVVGFNTGTGTVDNCRAEGDVSGTENIGGVVGYNNSGTIKNCNATSTVIGTGNQIGGVVGFINNGTVENSHATGDVSGNRDVGGVAGVSYSIVRNCYSTGNVSGTGYVGGVAGSNSDIVENCYATGNVSGITYVGGVAGGSEGTVINCYATGNVSGTGYNVGGVVGYSRRVLRNCYATGNVSGDSSVGGVVGASSGTVENCYASGVVSGNRSVGGVAGGANTVENCVALNPNINSQIWINGGAGQNTSFWRVGAASISNNYARRDMKFNDRAMNVVSAGLIFLAKWFNSTNGADGADITPVNYQLQSWWSSRAGFDFSATGVWEWHTANKLPVLKGLSQQNPKVSAFNTLETTFVVSGTAFEMVWINAGTFRMGSPESELNRQSRWETLHEVTFASNNYIGGGFYMGKYEVTQAQWEMVTGTTITAQQALATLSSTDNYGQGDNYPMYYVSWYDAIVFCNKLSMLEGLEPAYSINGITNPAHWGNVPTSSDATWNDVIIYPSSNGYRLPTEAQWEYSCRAGATEGFNWGTDYVNATQANYNAHLRRSSVVGSYAPNAWGLYDMHGNVAEWCWDRFDEHYGSEEGVAVTNPTGASSGNSRIHRGGGWIDSGLDLRSAARKSTSPQQRSSYRGFRIIRPQ